MKVASLASGSKGNACCLMCGGRVLMVDCGLGFSELADRAARAGVPLDCLDGVVFTHSHDDHVKGAKTFHRRFPGVPLFANMMTSETVAWQCGMDEADFVPFENGQAFRAGPFEIEPFSVPHDTSDPVGYLVRAGGETYFHGTDIGTPLETIGARLAEADVATLESNHDPVLLRRSGRPERLIRRIAGPRGHLSNDEACELVRRFASPRLRRLALAHLSEQCNEPLVAERAMRGTLDAMGRADVALSVLRQDEVVFVQE